MTAGLGGTALLLRLALRRDRVLVPAGVIGLAAFVAGSSGATMSLYPDLGSAAAALGGALQNPALVAMYGPISSLTLDAFATFKSVLLGAVFLCLLAYVVVRRHTRTEEESGRLELLGAGALGRRAPLAAAVLLATAAVLLTALLTAVSSIAVGLDATGSAALGVSWVVTGLTWVGVTAVAAQLSGTARGTAGLSLGALGLAFLVRAVGDTVPADSWLRHLTWLSPLGWTEKVAPYGANRFWVLGLGLVAYAVLLAVAFALLDRRDLGSGLLPSRGGPAHGTMQRAFHLTRRLSRGTVLGWSVAFAVLGAVVGSLGASVGTFAESSETADLLRRFGGDDGTIVDTFFATELGVAAVIASALGISIVTRMRSEETSMRAEALLAAPVRRERWALGHLAVAAGATGLVLVLTGVTAGLVDARRTGDALGSVASLAGAAVSTLPAVWVCIAVAVLFVGALPRVTGLVWAVLIIFLFLGEFGTLVGLPDVVRGLSPFAHLSRLPGGALELAPLVSLTLAAVALAAAGVAALRRRDFPA